MKRRKVNFINALITVALSLVLLLGGAFGCFDFDCGFSSSASNGYEFFFNETEIGMFVGEDKIYTAEDFSFEPSAPMNFTFKLTAADTNVLTIVEGKRVFARSSGVSELTATDSMGRTATCTVEVTGEIDKFELRADTRSRELGDIRATDIYAVINDGKVSAGRFNVSWSVNGMSVINYKGGTYTVAPSKRVELTTVAASVTNREGKVFEAEITVNTFDGTADLPTLVKTSGVLNQTFGSTSEVGFKLDGQITAKDIVEWYVNNIKIQEGGAEFGFTPDRVGQFEVVAVVNGNLIYDESIYLTVSGAVVPEGLKVDFDTFYPAVALKWDSVSADEIFTVRTTNMSDKSIKEFPATGGCLIIESGEINLFDSGYIFDVKSEGNGSYVQPSDYSAPLITDKLNPKIREYLEKRWFGGNRYISSDDEFFAFYDYMMLYRNQPVNRPTDSKATVYFGYKPNVTLSRLSEAAFNRAGYTGSYSIDVKRDKSDNNIVYLEFTFNTVSTPSKAHGEVSAKQLDGIAPHVSATGRDANTKLAADDESIPAAMVETTDQLYRILEMGYRPDFSSNENSRAKKAYDYAKKVLNRILDDDMTDVDKAHAIYDWIMWRVLYNSHASSISEISEAVKYSAFYIESVLTDDSFFAVCDGMSKTYSLMCNLEGIPCVRVTGTAYVGGSDGGHAWNKVKVRGQWYIVDCTWGDFQVQLKSKSLFGETVESYEIASHQYFLKTDAEMKGTHTEDEDTNYPQTSAMPYNLFNESRLDSSDFTCYVTDKTDLNGFSNALVSYINGKFDSNGKQTVATFNGIVKSDYVAVEVKIAEKGFNLIKAGLVDRSVGTLISALERAKLKYNIYNVDNYIIVITSKNVNLV